MTAEADRYGSTDLARQIATIRCQHAPKMKDRPCGKCVSDVTRALRGIRPKWVTLTARTLVKMDGFDCPPTPLILATALELLQAIVPTIRGSVAEPSTEET